MSRKIKQPERAPNASPLYSYFKLFIAISLCVLLLTVSISLYISQKNGIPFSSTSTSRTFFLFLHVSAYSLLFSICALFIFSPLFVVAFFGRYAESTLACKALHQKGYTWITERQAYEIKSTLGAVYRHLPHADHIMTIPGIDKDDIQTFIVILKNLPRRMQK
ncbi:hypothetical protein JXA32_16340 [Candidatus Sumerlaeota bacterium]|nr:hypothetical protein [Candidatus Sumerlaeota bacterium]